MQLCILFVIAFSLVSADLFAPSVVEFAGLKLAAIVIGQLLVVLSALVIVLQTQAEGRLVLDRRAVEQRFSRYVGLHAALWSVASVCVLAFFDLTQIVLGLYTGWPLLLARPLMLVPVLTPLMLSWAVFFDAECVLDPSIRKTWTSRWSYVVAHARRFLLVPLAALLGVVLWSDLVALSWQGNPQSPLASLVRLSPLLVLACAFPAVLRMVWGTQQLEDSALRTGLMSQCKEREFVLRDILVWDTQHRVANAAIVGILPHFRYVLLSDRLIRDLPPQQVETVFLHELGHAKHMHSAKRMASMMLAAASSIPWLNWVYIQSSLPFLVASAIAGCTVAISLRLVGRYARLLELQADLWAVRQTHDRHNYLRAIASVAHGDPDRVTWLHPSFQERCEFLLKGVQPASVLLRSDLRTALFRLVVWVCVLSIAGVRIG